MLLSGILCVLASKFKLANLGAYLPYPVLCGFFSAVAVMLWMLAFSVDMNGQKFADVIKSGDPSLMWQGVLHHSPSLIIGIIMKILGPKKPYYITTILLMTIGLTYGLLYATGTTLQEAQELNWFWTEEELSQSKNNGDGVSIFPEKLSFTAMPCPF
jgi:SulP family sulfate permease